MQFDPVQNYMTLDLREIRARQYDHIVPNGQAPWLAFCAVWLRALKRKKDHSSDF
jgi:hypothetical protein